MKYLYAGIVAAVLIGSAAVLTQDPFRPIEPEPAVSAALEQEKSVPEKTTLTWVGCGISKKAYMGELAAVYTEKTGIEIDIQGGGATRGIRDVAANKADMGGSCRHVLMVDQESNAKLIPVGWDALVVIVHPHNPVDDVTLVQMKAILSGEITSWKSLGGPNKKIDLVSRHQGAGGKISGVGRMTRELVFFNPEQDYTDKTTSVKSSTGVEKFVMQHRWSVGITGISSARRRNVKILGLDGATPSYDNIARGKYPLFRPLYLVLPKESEHRRSAEDFIAFAISDEGQKVLKQEGTVTLEDGADLWKKYRRAMLEAGIRMGDY